MLLIEDKTFYVYIYLDPTKKSIFIYDNLKFNYEPFYVGKGKGLRFLSHIKESYKTNKTSLKIEKIRNINFRPKIFIIKNLTQKEAFKLEKQLVLKIGRLDLNKGPLLNKTYGGEGISNRKLTEEHKQKISNTRIKRNIKHTKVIIEKIRLKRLGKKLSQKARENIKNGLFKRAPGIQEKFIYSRKNKKNSEEHNLKLSEWNKNKKLSEETKRKIGIANKGKITSEETKLKISKKLKNRIFSKETKEKISKALTGKKKSKETIEKHRNKMLGRKISEETKRKIGIANKNKFVSNNTKNKLAEKSSKNWKIIFKDGTEIFIKNLKKWCKENNIFYCTNFQTINKKLDYIKIQKME